jgi:hypothetical protein
VLNEAFEPENLILYLRQRDTPSVAWEGWRYEKGSAMREPLTAVATVRFGKSVTGEQLAALVRQVAGQNQYCGFVMKRSPRDGDAVCIGQTSGFAYNHILVAPSLDSASISLTERYSEVQVMRRYWGTPVNGVGYGQRQVTEAVQVFAAGLTQAYELALANGFPQLGLPNQG